jgi:hypothetical protein
VIPCSPHLSKHSSVPIAHRIRSSRLGRTCSRERRCSASVTAASPTHWPRATCQHLPASIRVAIRCWCSRQGRADLYCDREYRRCRDGPWTLSKFSQASRRILESAQVSEPDAGGHSRKFLLALADDRRIERFAIVFLYRLVLSPIIIVAAKCAAAPPNSV